LWRREEIILIHVGLTYPFPLILCSDPISRRSPTSVHLIVTIKNVQNGPELTMSSRLFGMLVLSLIQNRSQESFAVNVDHRLHFLSSEIRLGAYGCKIHAFFGQVRVVQIH